MYQYVSTQILKQHFPQKLVGITLNIIENNSHGEKIVVEDVNKRFWVVLLCVCWIPVISISYLNEKKSFPLGESFLNKGLINGLTSLF